MTTGVGLNWILLDDVYVDFCRGTSASGCPVLLYTLYTFVGGSKGATLYSQSMVRSTYYNRLALSSARWCPGMGAS